ncbi:MAG: hypothetical protein HXS47_09020 [Theionarchaea archaeon]|nr:hypothetical protein [Theionarchaea archaeon]
MRLTPPKKATWYICLLLWLLGVLFTFGIVGYRTAGSILLALSGIIMLLSVALKGL